MKLGLVVSGVFLGVLGLAACGGDDGGGSGGGGGSSSGGASSGGSGAASGAAGSSSGGSASGGAAGSSSGGSSSGGAAGAASGGGGGSSDLAECKAKAATNPDPACANCACDGCLAELKACEADPSCVGLRNCAQKNNCCDEICVLLKCGTELQAAGGVNGPGTTKAAAVKDCTVKAACNCCK